MFIGQVDQWSYLYARASDEVYVLFWAGQQFLSRRDCLRRLTMRWLVRSHQAAWFLCKWTFTVDFPVRTTRDEPNMRKSSTAIQDNIRKLIFFHATASDISRRWHHCYTRRGRVQQWFTVVWHYNTATLKFYKVNTAFVYVVDFYPYKNKRCKTLLFTRTLYAMFPLIFHYGRTRNWNRKEVCTYRILF